MLQAGEAGIAKKWVPACQKCFTSCKVLFSCVNN